MEEIWRDINGYDGLYQVSNTGKVRGVKRGAVLRMRNRSCGCRVYLSKNGYATTHNVHRLVATAFVPNPENKRYVGHKNGDRLDNTANNICWCTWHEKRKLIKNKHTEE